MDPLVFGNLEVRLAMNDAEVDAAQALRYRIFYEEMKASPTPRMRQTGRDVYPYDSVCDHPLIIDREHAMLFSWEASARRFLDNLDPFDPVRAWPGRASTRGRRRGTMSGLPSKSDSLRIRNRHR